MRITVRKYLYLYIIGLLWLMVFSGFLFVYLYAKAVAENANGWFGELPSLKRLENPRSDYASEVYTADSVLIGKFYRSNRTPVEYEDINPIIINTLMATEDIRFEEHSGIDMKGTFAIFWYLIKGDNRGSSTITQQLAKNLFKTRDPKFQGTLNDGSNPLLDKAIVKTKEWVTAVDLERAYTKKEIITMYLNTVDFGRNSFGIQVASKVYFNKDQKDINEAEAAMLIGLLKAPTHYNPVPADNREVAKSRRNTVLQQLYKYSFISREQLDSLSAQDIALDYKAEDHNEGLAPYFREKLREQLDDWCKEKGYDLYADGLKIYTTIDSRIQKHAEKAVLKNMKEQQALFFEHWEGKNPWVYLDDEKKIYREMPGFLEREIKKGEAYRFAKIRYGDDTTAIEKRLHEKKKMTVYTWEGPKDTLFSSYDSLKYYLHFLHTGFMSMDPKSGQIKAWVGDFNHEYFKYDHVIQAKRQPGSTFKPIVYATIIAESGGSYSPCYKAIDAPVSFSTGDPDNPTWTPQNADGIYSGDTLTLRQAMAKSINSITAYMMKIMGDHTPHSVYKYARNLGITSHLEPVPAMCLGTFDVSLYEMVGAYSAFVNEGVWTEPYFITHIEDRFGNSLNIADFLPEKRSALSQEMAKVMLHMLKGTTQEAGGTALGLYNYGLLNHENEIGAKTGTTSNFSDAWFMGVTPQLVSGCWVGGEHRSIHFRSIKYGQGAKMALPAWAYFMQEVYADTALHIQKQPITVDPTTISVKINCNTAKDESDNDENAGEEGNKDGKEGNERRKPDVFNPTEYSEEL